ncbi:hypothetical protein L083_2336 [Actinoplanes sp. N902-109]|nr:hypothetical protein L083_2336 [Actinoplanes sp. N902-109]
MRSVIMKWLVMIVAPGAGMIARSSWNCGFRRFGNARR